MVFSSLIFLFVFLPITMIIYYICPRILRNAVLLLASLVFYAWGEPVYIILMLYSIIMNYVMGLIIEKHKNEDKHSAMKMDLIYTVLINLAVLGFFKYYGFVVENLNTILPFDIPYKELALPIGISFYTFQTMSYIIDVYRDKVSAQKNIISFGAYVSMFPQLVAGPIVRYSDVCEQLNHRKETVAKFSNGMQFFVKGMAKKVLLANTIGVLFTTIDGMDLDNVSVVLAWLGCIAYTLQIYFDFSGYSDMAIGLGKMFGFDFIKNFDYPYIATSITDFWRRWHMSLSSWFREYVYIPLGGNRVSVGKHIRNILVVWFLTGLWHGASWNFIAWGMYYGIVLLIEKYFLADFLEGLPRVFAHIYSLIIIGIGWVFFFSVDLSSAFKYIGRMFGAGDGGFMDSNTLYYILTYGILFIIAGFCSTPVVKKHFERKTGFIASVGIYLLLFIVSVAYLVNATYNPFLYFRF